MMSKRYEIEEFMKKNHYNKYVIAEKYNNSPEELEIIKNILIEEEKYEDLEQILRAFPHNEEYDYLKREILDSYSNSLNDFDLCSIICCITNDNLKLEMYTKFYERIKEFNSLTIISFSDDNIKMKLYKEHRNDFVLNGEGNLCFYIRNLNDDDNKRSEFLQYKDDYNEINLENIALSFSNDDARISFYESNISLADTNKIGDFISGLDSDKKKKELLGKNFDILSEESLCRIIKSIDDVNIVISILNDYSDKMSSISLRVSLEKIDDQKSRIRLLDNMINQFNSEDVIELINSVTSISERMDLLDKYINKMNSNDLYSFCIHLPTEYKEKFLDQYIHYLDSNSICGICRSKSFDNNWTFKMVNKYIEYLDIKEIALLVEYYWESTYNGDVERVFLKYTKNVKDQKKLRLLYNVIAQKDSQYFIDNFYNDEQTFFTEEEKRICDKLYKRNKFLFKTFNFDLLYIDELKSNFHCLEKLSKFPDISKMICDLHKNNLKASKILFSMLDYVCNKDIYYDDIMVSIIYAICDVDILDELDLKKVISNIDLDLVNEVTIKNLMFKILKSYNIQQVNEEEFIEKDNEPDLKKSIFGDLIEKKRIYKNKRKATKYIIDVEVNSFDDICNYETNLDKKIDEIFSKTEDRIGLQNLIFNKFFGIDYPVAVGLLREFKTNLNNSNSEIFSYIKELNRVLSMESPSILKEYYYNAKKFPKEKIIFIDRYMKKEIASEISSSLLKIKDCKPDRIIKYGNSEIPMYIPKQDFKLIVNSLVAYTSTTEIGNYNDFWNGNDKKKITNHGICCSLISNQNLCQTAPIEDILVGIDGFSDNAIQLMKNADAGSYSNNFDFRSVHESRFMTSDELINHTRHNHNELVIEREELREEIKINSPFSNIQLSYVVLYSHMSDEQYKKSLKAAAELSLPILYLDSQKIAADEASCIERLGKKAEKELSISDFEKMVVRRENNVHSYSRDLPNYNELFFGEDKINNYINNFYKSIFEQYQMGMIDKDIAGSLYSGAISILQKEKDKRGDFYEVNGALNIDSNIEKANQYVEKIASKSDIQQSSIPKKV